jgi:heme/copper-type cytochrome/quinol oxidase subunit 4
VGTLVARLLAGSTRLSGVGPWLGLSGFTVISVAVLIYTFFALRRAYGGGWLRTAAKFLALVLIYSIVVGVGFVIYSLGVMLLV